MSNTAGTKKRSWLKILLWIASGFAGLVIVAYFVLTSAWFLKSIVLPKVSTAMNASVTIEDAGISPFSSVTLTGLKVQVGRDEPILTAQKVWARYSLMDIIKGNINIEEVGIADPMIQVTELPDGTRNVDVLTKNSKSQPAPKESPKENKGPVKLDLKKFALSNATVRYSKLDKTGAKMVVVVDGLNITADHLANGATAALNFASGLSFDQTTSTNHSSLKGKLGSTLNLALDNDLKPVDIKGGMKAEFTQAAGAFQEVNGLVTTLDCDLTMKEIRNIALKFARNGNNLGVITVSGPFDAQKVEGKLKGNIAAIDRQVLNLVGRSFNLDFGSTTISSSGVVELLKGGQLINIDGSVTAAKISVTQMGQTTPALDVTVSYNLSVDQAAKSADIRTFNIDGLQDRRELIKGALAKPMKVAWGSTGNAVDESAFDLNINNLKLADWRAFAAGTEPAGSVNLRLNLLSRQAGKKLALNLGLDIADFAAKLGSNQVAEAGLQVKLDSDIDNFSQVAIKTLEAKVSHRKATAVTFTGSGQFDSAAKNADLKTRLEAALPVIAQLLGNPAIKISSGSLAFDGNILQKNLTPGRTNDVAFERGVNGNLDLTRLSGECQKITFDRFETLAQLDLGMKDNVASIKKIAAAIKQAGQPGGNMEVTGTFNTATTNGQLTLKVSDLNQNTFRSVAAMLAPNTLQSISINANATAQYDPKGESGIKADLQVLNCLLTDPKGQLPKTPISISALLDAGMKNDLASLRQCQGDIKMGSAAGGAFDVKGAYDLKKQAGNASVKVNDLNQNALRPFLASALGDKTLESISINFAADAKVDMANETTLKADLNVANCVIKDPSQQIPATPLGVRLAVDGGMNKQVLALRQASLQLAPTALASNKVELTGTVDMSRSNLISGALKLASTGLDLTPMYDLFASKPAAQPAQAPAPTAPAQPKTEPPAIAIPLTNFTFDADIAKIFLREVAINNLSAKMKIDGGKINVSQFNMVMNGAPINSRAFVDVGVPGYTYDVDFGMQKLPLDPLINSFAPAAKGTVKGDLFANLGLTGAGITDKSLRSNLAGQGAFSLTNAVVATDNKYAKPILLVLSIALKQPNLMTSPLDYVGASFAVGKGKIDLQKTAARSPLVLVEPHGDIQMAEVLTNSPMNLPVEVSVPPGAAKTFGLSPASPNDQFVKMPQFASVKGTLGAYKLETDNKVLLGLLASGVGGRLGGQAGQITRGIGGLLSGAGSGSATNAPAATTNAPAPSNPVNNLLNGLLGNSRTNAPAQPTNPAQPATPTNKTEAVKGLLRGLLK